MREPLILTFTGRHVNPLNVRPEDVCEEDVAHHLSYINRFNGTTNCAINVAQHAVYVSRLLDGTGFEWQGLHHDDAEAYVGDVTKWLKMSDAMRGFREAEDIAQVSCYTAFGVEAWSYVGYPHLMHPLVVEADKTMLRFEGLMGFGIRLWKRWSDEVTKYPMITEEECVRIGKWRPWTAKQAEEAYHERLRSLRASGLDRPEPDRRTT